MLDNPAFWILFAAYAIVWLVLGGYVFTLSRRQREIEREIEVLEDQLRNRQ